MTHKKRWIAASATIILAFGLGYVWRATHFQSHFLSDTEIAGVHVGGQTAAQAAQTLRNKLSNQRYTISEHQRTLTTFTSKEAGVKAYSTATLQQLLAKQNAFAWPMHLTTAAASDQSLSKQAIDQTQLNRLASQVVASAGTNRTKTVNATLVYQQHKFQIKAPTYGTEVTQASVAAALSAAVRQDKTQINLKQAYVKPTVLANSPKLKAAKTKATTLSKNTITYHLARHTVQIPSDTIASWLTTTNGNVSVSQPQILKYLTKLSYKYGTVHHARHFKTTGGSTVTVPAGLYGWSIKVASETPKLAKIVLAGKSTTRTPVIQGTGYHANGTDIGNTYVEVSKAHQHMWIYKHGKLVISTAVVTGKPVKGTTPSGVYVVWSKQRNATLRGQNDDGSNYASPVSYWMPVDDTGVGIHDSPWQPRYGGNWYLTHGSHGCVNTPPSVMSKVYATVPLKTPVVIY
ncbi:L,D-transpeptidase family protein [Secundilactobacillus muriivasis]